eukprot:PhM_4_TR18420/c5_g5_i1/m.85174
MPTAPTRPCSGGANASPQQRESSKVTPSALRSSPGARRRPSWHPGGPLRGVVPRRRCIRRAGRGGQDERLRTVGLLVNVGKCEAIALDGNEPAEAGGLRWTRVEAVELLGVASGTHTAAASAKVMATVVRLSGRRSWQPRTCARSQCLASAIQVPHAGHCRLRPGAGGRSSSTSASLPRRPRAQFLFPTRTIQIMSTNTCKHHWWISSANSSPARSVRTALCR